MAKKAPTKEKAATQAATKQASPPVKETAAKKVAAKAKEAPAKKAEAKVKAKPVKKAAVKQGSRYACSVCGLAVTVDTVCDCIDTCDIICCGETMKAKR